MIEHADVLAGLGEGLLAVTGTAAPAYRRAVADSRLVRPGDLFVALRGERVDGNDFVAEALARGAAGALVERAPVTLPSGAALYRVADALCALQRLAAWHWRRRPLPALAVTGTVGKTSTKEVAARLFAHRYRVFRTEGGLNGDIGLPLALLALEPDDTFAVLELGMHRRGEVALQCRIAPPTYGIVTNIGFTHMERLGSQAAIVAAKQELVEALPAQGSVALNGDDPLVLGMRAAARCRVLTYGLTPGCDVRADAVLSLGRDGLQFELGYGGRRAPVRTPLVGRHHVHTCLSAAAIALADGFGLEETAAALATVENPLRLTFTDGPNGSVLIDDTYNASPASMAAALSVLSEQTGRRIAVLGDMLELGDVEEREHRTLGRRAAEVADVAYFVGRRAGTWSAEAARAAAGGAVRSFATKEELAPALAEELRAGDVVLLKGSRGLALETVIDALKTRAGD